MFSVLRENNVMTNLIPQVSWFSARFGAHTLGAAPHRIKASFFFPQSTWKIRFQRKMASFCPLLPMLIFLKIGHHFQSPLHVIRTPWGRCSGRRAHLRGSCAFSSPLRTALSQGWGTAHTLPVTVAAGTLIRFQMQSVFNKGVYSFEFFGLTGISEEINFWFGLHFLSLFWAASAVWMAGLWVTFLKGCAIMIRARMCWLLPTCQALS